MSEDYFCTFKNKHSACMHGNCLETFKHWDAMMHGKYLQHFQEFVATLHGQSAGTCINGSYEIAQLLPNGCGMMCVGDGLGLRVMKVGCSKK